MICFTCTTEPIVNLHKQQMVALSSCNLKRELKANSNLNSNSNLNLRESSKTHHQLIIWVSWMKENENQATHTWKEPTILERHANYREKSNNVIEMIIIIKNILSFSLELKLKSKPNCETARENCFKINTRGRCSLILNIKSCFSLFNEADQDKDRKICFLLVLVW